jgi:hypothetical protein
MNTNLNYLVPKEDDQKVLRKKFLSEKIVYGWNSKTKRHEAWYKPGTSPPYVIGKGHDFWDIVRQIAHRRAFDKMRAEQMLEYVDGYNKRLQDKQDDDVMAEARSTLRHVASGRKMFLT